MTHWIAKAFKRVYLKYKDVIITYFKNISLSLTVDNSEDHLLKVRDCLNLIIND
jgi:hypothetical protein